MRKLFAALAVVLTALVLSVISAGPASGLGGESLGCAVYPSAPPGGLSNPCYNNSAPASEYTLTFAVTNETGSYSYAWSVPSPWSGRIVGGCTSTTDYCQFTAGNRSAEIDVAVTLTQAGSSETLYASAEMDPWCGNYLC